MTAGAARRRRDLAAALVVAALAAGFLIWAYQYGPRTREFPVLVGWLLLGLCVLDIVKSSPTAIGARLSRGARWAAAPPARPVRRELAAVLWVAGFLGAVALAGFLVSVPLYVLAFMAIQGRRTIAQCLAGAALTTLFIYVVFEWLLHYEVYRGLLFLG